MSIELMDYQIVETAEALENFRNENKDIEWIAFDTEFIGEKRYKTLLCLIQLATVNGYYLIDPIKLESIDLLLEVLQDPKIKVLTHAGENDYRLLYKNYGILPQNIFDAQIAAGFVGYKYPISFRKLAEKEAGVRLSKGYTVSDWQIRPINAKQVKYALNDVIYLYKIWKNLSAKLEKAGRLEWVEEEFARLSTPEYYYIDPNREALTNSLILGLNVQEQVFLIRIYAWRRSEAERKDYSKEMVLPAKYIGPIVRNINSGKAALKNHRRIPKHILENYWEMFNRMFQDSPTDQEREILSKVTQNPNENPKHDTLMEILYLLIKYQCHKDNLAPELLLVRSEFKKMKADLSYFDHSLDRGWREIFLGKEMIHWLKQRSQLEIQMVNGEFKVMLNEG